MIRRLHAQRSQPVTNFHRHLTCGVSLEQDQIWYAKPEIPQSTGLCGRSPKWVLPQLPQDICTGIILVLWEFWESWFTRHSGVSTPTLFSVTSETHSAHPAFKHRNFRGRAVQSLPGTIFTTPASLFITFMGGGFCSQCIPIYTL